MSRLPQLRASFLDAAGRHVEAPARLADRRRPLRLIIVAVLCLLLLAAAALAATGVLRIGSPVPSRTRLTPTVGLGVPSRGGSRLLAVSYPDPAGGPPWGMRVVHTSRDLVCLQVGRLYRGRLGVLGRDGAFANDGRFHPLPPSAISREGGQCQLAGTYSSNEISGIPDSGLPPASGELGALPRARWVSYGLLGPDAVSVTYRDRARSHTVQVERLTGAYVVVLPGIEPGTRGIQSGASFQHRGPNVAQQPSGAITAITYRIAGRLCEVSVQARVSNACPSVPPAAAPGPRVELHRVVRVHLRRAPTPGGYGATVSFAAPFAVPNARSGYSIAIAAPCRAGIGVDPIDRNIKAGTTVIVPMDAIFANACGPTVTIEVLYNQHGERPAPGRGTTLVGRVVLTRPR
jgi:hypothetical protein